MNDRFKFRIYCKSEKKMMLFNNPTLIDGDIMHGGILFKNYDHKIRNCHEVNPEDLILMQCTGLKDKNGKLIYEGDIINIWCKNLTKNQISDVFYCEERAAFCFHYETDYGNIVPCTMDKTEMEVIGNIYENSELLKECE